MFSIITNVKKLLLIILMLFLLVSCSKDNNNFLNIDNTQYVISISKQLEHNAKLLFIDENGTLLDDYSYKGYGINYIEEYDGDIYMYSKRLNQHYKLDKEGNVTNFSLLDDIYKDKGIGVWFISKGKDSLIESMNIGYVNKEYLSNVLYVDGNNQKEVVFKNKLMVDAIEYDNKIFVKCYSVDDNVGGICIIDKKSAISTEPYYFKDEFIANGLQKLMLYKDKIVIYGDNTNTYSDKILSGVGTLDINTYDTISIVLDENVLIMFAYIYNDYICIVTSDNYIHYLNEDLEIVKRYKIDNNTASVNYYNQDIYINKVIEQEDLIHVVYGSLNMDDKDNLGFIQVYRKSDMYPVSKIPIINPSAKTWMGEHLDVIMR